ncbi:uncharacterized protein PGTG_03148 [Puccinia graminis f. sp. tritici CRL 75-36-700-3]|uniref:AB hydrolase-1 domain-containing protein n=1 Tax=Puccinia graminis f. sp. tritici (strain CRL 75-36-700-3 / race SCCL) TaxID=418459 RepID=E3JYR7_PUCGT|nr:uncharacterized protein PGTG_03148 [Puccinia graminis f. sp. tritici CRL 75-36-700-3]EFP77192.2 hypothetical protein PGTG_03148 [Puccinia graminis f. sp. tritici CRL 75-36-700-3]
MASSGPIGLQADHVYRSQLSPWRFKIWSILLVTLDKEMPILESIQRSYRSGPLDRLMIFLACSGWSNQVKHFSRKPDHSVLVLDNQGVGNSDAGPLGIYKTSEMAKDTVDLMEYLGWTEEQSVHLFGVSMGGMISQELCLLVPRRFKSVSFTSTKAGNKFDLPSMHGLYSLTQLLSRTITEEQSIEMLMNMLFPAEFLAQSTEARQRDADSRIDPA